MKKLTFMMGMLLIVFVFCSILASCFSTGNVRDTIPQVALTLQRIRHEVDANLPMYIYVDNVSYELANGETKTITVKQGEYVTYAVLGDQETKTQRFTVKDKTVTITAGWKGVLLGLAASFEIEVIQ